MCEQVNAVQLTECKVVWPAPKNKLMDFVSKLLLRFEVLNFYLLRNLTYLLLTTDMGNLICVLSQC